MQLEVNLQFDVSSRLKFHHHLRTTYRELKMIDAVIDIMLPYSPNQIFSISLNRASELTKYSLLLTGRENNIKDFQAE